MAWRDQAFQENGSRIQAYCRNGWVGKRDKGSTE